MSFPETLLSIRKRNGMSQEQLAEALGVSRQTISKWELGTAVPDTANVIKLSKLFGVSADHLLLDKDVSAQKPAVHTSRFVSKAEYLLAEKGYWIGYYLMWKELCAVIGGILIAWIYLEAISISGIPLLDLPIQAFFLPIIAAGLSVICLIRFIIICILTIKFKNLDHA